jgi:glycerol-3-phosphate acyltransferase PlsY
MLSVIMLAVLSYLLGSIPTAIIAGKVIKNIDIREHGSGNAGATNVFRVLGWRAGLIVLSFDMLKGFLAAWLFIRLFPDLWSGVELRIYWQMMAGTFAIVGHIWTVFAGFKGGKGVGTAAGVFIGLQPFPVLICLLVFFIIVAVTRYVSLGSISGAILLPVILSVQKIFHSKEVPLAVLMLSVLLALLIVYTHRQNIKRLLQGTENKLVFNKKEDTA